MPRIALKSIGSIPNHKLQRNLQLQDNYISNDGGDEGIKIADNGDVNLRPQAQDIYDFEYDTFRMKKWANSGDKIELTDSGSDFWELKTYADPDSDAANLTIHPDGSLILRGSGYQGVQILPDTKTASGLHDSTLSIAETLNMSSGAGGDDVHHGIKYKQTQTNLAGWDEVK